MNYNLGVLISHPIQYYSPWFSYLANHLNLEVYYAHNQDKKGQAEAGFGVEFGWDTPLLEGYNYRFLKNKSKNPGLNSFNGCDTPEIYKIIREKKFDAFLIVGWNYKSSIQGIISCYKTKVPVLMRGDSNLITKRSKFKSFIKFLPYKLILPRIGAHLYVGKRNYEYLKHYGIKENKLFFVPHFVDNNFFLSNTNRSREKKINLKIRKSLNIPENAFVLIFVGKLIDKKRPYDLIKACLKLFKMKDQSDIYTIFVGDGILKKDLEVLSISCKDRIRFVGFINQNDLPYYYSSSDILILTSDSRETWGLVVNECMACGIPPIISEQVGCAPDLIREGETGYTYPTGDIDALVKCIIRLKGKCKKDYGNVRISIEKTISNYSIENATSGLENALENILYNINS